jgi:hypothetical protein
LTGGVGSIIGNPFDVLKTLAQANQGKSVPLMTLVGDMYKEQGMAGFYRGVTANIMRAWYVTCFEYRRNRSFHPRLVSNIMVAIFVSM